MPYDTGTCRVSTLFMTSQAPAITVTSAHTVTNVTRMTRQPPIKGWVYYTAPSHANKKVFYNVEA